LKQVGVFTATRRELNAVRRSLVVERRTRIGGSPCIIGHRANCRLYLFQTGVGTVKAGAVCRAALASQRLDLAISSGFACALVPSGIGDLLIGQDVIVAGRDEALPCAATWRKAAVDAASAANVPSRIGRFVTIPGVVWRAEDKRRLAAGTGAIGLDMESAALGRAAADAQVPFVVVRAVSDLVDEDLPIDFDLFFNRAGWLRGGVLCLTRPSVLIGLNRLRRQTDVASGHIGRFFERFLDDLS
jgi:adenosylhomocysteine nucleosidase